ncbi:hypothetical protein RISINGSUN_123 [Erwinia phage vB_EamM_RisingSun]|uniref:Lipoprotein n=1 Tax=Erwinia phage vB_EamM_RisingSun TaxID=2026080 RepID=A0A223LGK7_9CAUD|nr:Cor superinfection exclusion protein [Erwinia phage vB_EamM_RisingSun]ASU03547.1 hypothetical protein RISINGSUN_123 [Erwinia phage vB_EamM_RisingSun]
MKKFIAPLVAVLLSACATQPKPAVEVTYECSNFTMGRITSLTEAPAPSKIIPVKQVVVQNDEGYFIPKGGAFERDRYYFWLNEDASTQKAVSGKLAMTEKDSNFVIYAFRTPYNGTNPQDVVGYMALLDCVKK